MLSYMGEYVRSIVYRKINMIRAWLSEYNNPVPVYVGFSGGKDSSATLALAVDAWPHDIIGVFWHIPGQTIIDNVLVARRVAKTLGLRWETIHVVEPLEVMQAIDPASPGVVYHVVIGREPYWVKLAANGPPSPPPRPRWCCRFYKEDPMNWLPVIGKTRYIITGVKRTDSPARAKRWDNRCEQEFRPRQGPARLDIALAPICDLRDPEVWAVLEYYGLDDIIRGQYEKWGRSPNCVLCPLASKRQLERAARLLPTSYLQRYHEALKNWDTALARRMRAILEAELERRGGPAREKRRG